MMPLIMWHLVIFTLPKKVGQKNHIRYSGSPIAMGFGEIGRHKQVLIVDLPLNKSVPISKLPKNDDLHGENQDNNAISIHSLPVPIFFIALLKSVAIWRLLPTPSIH